MRTKKSTINFIAGSITQVLAIICGFLVRTIFIKNLGIEYLGVNGLFTNVLTILSLAELGIGSAIIFSLYKPIAENNQDKVKKLLQFYRKTYRKIALIVAIIGLLIIPFLKLIIKTPPDISENIIIIYILYLANTVLSYLWTYKRTIFLANQEEYCVNLIHILTLILRTLLLIISLLVFKNFILYLIVLMLFTIIENFLISIYANKKYQYLKEKVIISLEEEEKSSIFKNVKALIYYKVGSVILNGTDSIIMSILINITVVGIYSNYYLIISAIVAVIGSALSGISGSIGNLNATADNETKEKVFYQMFLVTVWIYGYASICLLILIEPTIKIWLGSNYVMEYLAVVALIVHMFINGIQYTGYTYRTTLGLFEKGKFAPIVATLLNIVLSIVLYKIIGLSGIFFATGISRLLTTTWVDPYIIHKYEFKTKLDKYFKKYLLYTTIVILNFIVCYMISKYIPDYNFLLIVLKAIIISIISNIIFLVAFIKNKDFSELLGRLKIFRGKKV